MPNGNIADQAAQLASLFSDLADSVDQVREANAAQLSNPQLDDMVALAQKLENLSDEENAQSIAANLAQVQNNVAGIIAATKDAQHAVKTIDNVQHAFAIASAAASLGSAIVSGNVSTIASASQSLLQAVATATAAGPGQASGAGGGAPGGTGGPAK